ncbi:hypothetical protein KKA47_06510, partial [bacterium]|nr:hypothetical protein [bacterium]
MMRLKNAIKLMILMLIALLYAYNAVAGEAVYLDPIEMQVDGEFQSTNVLFFNHPQTLDPSMMFGQGAFPANFDGEEFPINVADTFAVPGKFIAEYKQNLTIKPARQVLMGGILPDLSLVGDPAEPYTTFPTILTSPAGGAYVATKIMNEDSIDGFVVAFKGVVEAFFNNPLLYLKFEEKDGEQLVHFIGTVNSQDHFLNENIYLDGVLEYPVIAEPDNTWKVDEQKLNNLDLTVKNSTDIVSTNINPAYEAGGKENVADIIVASEGWYNKRIREGFVTFYVGDKKSWADGELGFQFANQSRLPIGHAPTDLIPYGKDVIVAVNASTLYAENGELDVEKFEYHLKRVEYRPEDEGGPIAHGIPVELPRIGDQIIHGFGPYKVIDGQFTADACPDLALIWKRPDMVQGAQKTAIFDLDQYPKEYTKWVTIMKKVKDEAGICKDTY